MKVPKPIKNLINHFERLPGIGPKTAQRLVFHLLHFPASDLEAFAEALMALKRETLICDVCKNIGDSNPCGICSDYSRDAETIAVVSSPLDVISIENSGYTGMYHVLHGVIDPLNNIGPEDIFLNDLLERLKNAPIAPQIELILATGTNMEGESTAMYIAKIVKEDPEMGAKIKVTRIARGLPVGGDVEYADSTTLKRALDGRLPF